MFEGKLPYKELKDAVINIAEILQQEFIDNEYFRVVMNNMDLIVYVLGLNGDLGHKNHEILWMNKKAKEVYGDGVGKKCYEVFYNFQFPCEFCMDEEMKKNPGEVFKWIRFNPVLNKLVEITSFVVERDKIKFKVSTMRDISFIVAYLSENKHFLHGDSKG